MATDSSTRPRRWLQFSLRTLLLVMVPVGCLAAWLGAEQRRGEREKEAIAWVGTMGGEIVFDDNATQRDWRRRLFGKWYPGVVHEVDFVPYELRTIDSFNSCRDTNPRVTEIGPLAGLSGVRVLDLSTTRVSDLAPIAGWRCLERLELRDTEVTNISPLASMPELREVALSSYVSNLGPLAPLDKLQMLTVRCRDIESLEVIGQLKSLKLLSLAHTNVSQLEPLANLKQLQVLSLSHTRVSDLSPLAGLASLRLLDISHTEVSDLSPLYGLAELRCLRLRGMAEQVSEAQRDDMQQALPNCKVELEFSRTPARDYLLLEDDDSR